MKDDASERNGEQLITCGRLPHTIERSEFGVTVLLSSLECTVFPLSFIIYPEQNKEEQDVLCLDDIPCTQGHEIQRDKTIRKCIDRNDTHIGCTTTFIHMSMLMTGT